MVGGREGGEREVEVSLFLKYCIILVSPSLFPSFPFILFHPYLLLSVHKQLFFPAKNHVSDPIFPLASKIMPDDIYKNVTIKCSL